MEITQRMIQGPSGKRTGIKLDRATWQAVEWLAQQTGKTWQAWCTEVMNANADSDNMTGAIRSAAMEQLLAETIFLDRADQFNGYQSVGMRLAGQCGDKEFNDDLAGSNVEFSSDFGGFTAKTGTDRYGRVCFWFENGLRNTSHLVVRTPFTPKQWESALEAENAD